MDHELKRLAVICGLVLVIALALLLPFAKWGMPIRPGNVPSTAVFGNGGKGLVYWIDCRNFAGPNQYSCTVYQAKSGDVVLKGIFQQTSFTGQQKIFYDGSAIHWRHGQLLRPVQFECTAGGRPPLVPDCKATSGPKRIHPFKP